MNVEHLTGVLGARISGLDLTTLNEQQAASLRAAICQHQVVVIPGQALSPAQQTAFSHQLGPFSPVPFVEPLAGFPEVISVVKEAFEPDAFNFGGVWHSDFSFLESPPAFTILQAIDVPTVGGDTVWASMTAAWEALTPDQQERFTEMTAVHSASASYSPAQQALHSGLSSMDIRTSTDAEDTQEHPLVCVHPETGEQTLFFNGTYVRSLRGSDLVSPAAVEKTLHWLHQWTTHVRFTFRHRWRNGDVVIWDNRSTQHVALNDYPGQRRQLHRTTVAGTPPNK